MDPVDQRSPPQQQSQLSLGALDGNVWDGLTFASSITNSDRDSLSPDHPPHGVYKTHSDFVSSHTNFIAHLFASFRTFQTAMNFSMIHHD
jgi:hypothetical protein